MSKPLFENAGKDIKKIAQVVANWIVGMHVVLALLVLGFGGFLVSEEIMFGWVLILVAFGIVVWGYGLSRLLVVMLYAYGEITDRLISIDMKISEKKEVTKKESGKKGSISVKREVKSEIHRTSPWECQFCGNINPVDSRFCKSCRTEDIGT